MIKKSDKRGNDILFERVIFIVLNILVFGILLGFVFKSSTGAVVYEKAYPKQIALIIDSAKPGMIIKLNMEQGKKIAEKNKWAGNIAEIKENQVIIRLADRKGYNFKYFSDYDISSYFDENFLIIVIDEKTGEKNV